jgi:L-arabinose transport system permease protein
MASSPSVVSIAPSGERKGKSLLRGLWENGGMLIIFVLMFIALSAFVPNFFSIPNLIGLSLSVSMVGMVACTMLFCLSSGDFDMSVGAIVAFCGVLAAVVIQASGSILVGVAAALAAGMLVGLLNGFIIAKLHINALITTLATMQIVRGLGYIASNGVAVGIGDERFFRLGAGSLLGLPNPIWITIACFTVFGILLNMTVFGRNTLAIGGNKEAARLSGIDVDMTKIAIFAIQGLVASFAGIILASRMTSGQPTASNGFELDVISACVLGGVSLSGGVGTMLGTIVGVLIMGTVQNALNLLNVPTFYQYVVRGLILLLAVLFDRLKQRKAQ